MMIISNARTVIIVLIGLLSLLYGANLGASLQLHITLIVASVNHIALTSLMVPNVIDRAETATTPIHTTCLLAEALIGK